MTLFNGQRQKKKDVSKNSFHIIPNLHATILSRKTEWVYCTVLKPQPTRSISIMSNSTLETIYFERQQDNYQQLVMQLKFERFFSLVVRKK